MNNNNKSPLPDESEEEIALRWRQAILKLTENFTDAAGQRVDLSPILMGALHTALEKLLLHGEEEDLYMLEEWLSEEEERPADPASPSSSRADWKGPERRARSERRRGDRRSGGDRRAR